MNEDEKRRVALSVAVQDRITAVQVSLHRAQPQSLVVEIAELNAENARLRKQLELTQQALDVLSSAPEEGR